MPWKPAYPGEVPSLGLYAIQWMYDHLASPDRAEYEPFQVTEEQAQFIIDLYAINPRTGKRQYRRGVISRPKGWGKSPLLSAIGAFEGLGECVPDGWDADGRPVGRPWVSIRTPWVQFAAVNEDQTRNAWAPLLEMLTEGPAIDDFPGLEPLGTFVNLPKGRIEFITSAATSKEGQRPVFAVLDQTESWLHANGGVKLAATMRRNLGKTNGCSVEAPNAYEPGAGSVAEESAEYWRRIESGRVKDAGLLYDHREAPSDTDMADRVSLVDGLKVAYGDSADLPRCVIHQPGCRRSGWVNLDRIVAEIWDPATDPQDARQYYLNQVVAASDAWVSSPQWGACAAPDKTLPDDSVVVLGFDGSRGRVKGKADATALIGCRVSDGHLFEVGVWEPDGADPDWLPPVAEVDAVILRCFERWDVVGFYADPSGWSEQVARWEAKYSRKLKVKAGASPIAAWPRGKDSRVGEYVERLRQAVVNGECTHDGRADLTRHVLNARRRATRTGYLLYKEHPDSHRKIDAAYAAVMAWKARTDALGDGFGGRRPGGGSGSVLVL